jgi:hypothetical protein
VPGERGKNFRVGDVLKVGVVLADELGSKRRGHEDAGREVRIFIHSEAIAEGERFGVEGLKKIGFIVLRVFPVSHGGGQIGVQGVGEDLEEGSGSLQDVRVDVVEVLEIGHVADDPYLITIQKHNLSCAFVSVAQIRLVLELVVGSDLGSQIRR